MRDAINSPAWGILDDWRLGGENRSVSVHRSSNGYLLNAADYSTSPPLHADSYCSLAANLDAAARELIRRIEERRANTRRDEIDRLREQLAALERAELESCSSVECAAVSHELATDAAG